MARTPSTMLPLGTEAPPFRLPDTEGRTVSLDDFDGAPAYLVIFLCNHCPFVVHVRDGIARVAREYAARGVAVFGISANDVENYPDDHPDLMKEEKEKAGYVFPYLFDESQETAKAYRAACTPDFFLFGRDRRLFYRGRMDGARPGNDVPVTGEDLRSALDRLLAGEDPPASQKPSLGCNIKWKEGNAPDYFG